LPGGGIDRSTGTIQHTCNAHVHVHVHVYGVAAQRIAVTRGFGSQLYRTDTATDAEFASDGICPGRALRRGVPERRP
jgi:hypothetical protein